MARTPGRKPVPLELVKARGNPSKKGLPKDSERLKPPHLDQPMPPPHLCDEAKVEWGRLVGPLCTLKLLSVLDVGAFAAYCQAYGRWVQAERAVAEVAKDPKTHGGLLAVTSNGNVIQHPLIGVANKAMHDLIVAAAEFGMTPSARSRTMGTGGGAGSGNATPENPFDAFKRRA